MWFAELQRIIRIIRYSNSWDRIVLFVFGIRSICNFRIVFEYPNSCYRIPNSYKLFLKQKVYQKYRKKLHIATKTKNQIFLFSCCLKFNLLKNISDNEHQLILSIHYSVFSIPNSWVQIVLFIFGFWSTSVFIKFSITNTFCIRSKFTIRCNSDSSCVEHN